MEEDTITLVFKLTLSSGETRSHSYPNCPTTKDAFNKWWDEQMKTVFTKTQLRRWLKLKNPNIFYQTDHIVSWEFEHTGNEEFTAILDEKTAFMLQVVGSV